MKALMLTPRMTMGHGVAEAVAMQVRGLRAIGIDCAVGVLEFDDTYADVAPFRLAPDVASVIDAVVDTGASAVVAHGSPYFEVLPGIAPVVRTVAYEYGDPTPALFAEHADQRAEIAAEKRTRVYPAVSHVAAISEFVRHDIGWPDARVIRLGVEHIPDLGPKPWIPPPDRSTPLRVATLMRLGAGEARYKGHDELLALAGELAGAPIAFSIMGRGTATQAREFRDAGFEVHLNADDGERTRFLRDADVFVTTSLWEGMNLPLVEAQALGTPGLAPDTGAHPEFTPLVFASVPAMAAQLAAYERDRRLVTDHGRLGYRYVRSRLSWDTSVLGLANLLDGSSPPSTSARGSMARQWARVRRLQTAVSESGVRAAARYHLDRVQGRSPEAAPGRDAGDIQ